MVQYVLRYALRRSRLEIRPPRRPVGPMPRSLGQHLDLRFQGSSLIGLRSRCQPLPEEHQSLGDPPLAVDDVLMHRPSIRAGGPCRRSCRRCLIIGPAGRRPEGDRLPAVFSLQRSD
jgi:hypothetical protein